MCILEKLEVCPRGHRGASQQTQRCVLKDKTGASQSIQKCILEDLEVHPRVSRSASQRTKRCVLEKLEVRPRGHRGASYQIQRSILEDLGCVRSRGPKGSLFSGRGERIVLEGEITSRRNDNKGIKVGTLHYITLHKWVYFSVSFLHKYKKL